MNKEQLITEITQANMAYSAGIPFMPDSEYDLLWQQLYAIDPHNSLLYHTAQNRAVIANKTWHKYPIFGTNKAFNMQDLTPFLMRFGSYKLKIEPKYDGCAAVITKTASGYILTLEGDGKCGTEINNMLNHISFPFKPMHFQAVELIIPFCDWDPSFGKNPRNTVSGWLARKHEKPPIKITAIPHNYGSLFEEYTYSGDLESFGEYLLNVYTKWAQIYPMDGLMIKVADEKVRLIAGNNGQTNNWSIAWKPPIQVKETTVVDIEWNVSRLGRVIPTVIYEPIELCGTTNNRVTGNNAKWIYNQKITIGAIITVGKAGEIIPKIIKVKPLINTSKEDYFLKICPKCNEELIIEGVHLVCNGPKCISKIITSLAYFYSNKGIKIDGIGESSIEKLLQDQTCYEVLSTRPWALLDMLSYEIYSQVYNILGESFYKNLIEQVNQVNHVATMANFISALGLPGLAYKSSLRLCQYLKTGKINIHITDNAKQSFITAVTVFSEAVKEMKNFSFASIAGAAKAIYCITGTLTQSREAMIEILNGYDYEFSSSVTRETNYLIVGTDPGNNKIDKATRYNIPQITEEQLFALLKKEK